MVITLALGIHCVVAIAQMEVAKNASGSLTSPITGGQKYGNCLTGTYTFDAARIYTITPGVAPPNLDISKYDFTIDYGAKNMLRVKGF